MGLRGAERNEDDMAPASARWTIKTQGEVPRKETVDSEPTRVVP